MRAAPFRRTTNRRFECPAAQHRSAGRRTAGSNVRPRSTPLGSVPREDDEPQVRESDHKRGLTSRPTEALGVWNFLGPRPVGGLRNSKRSQGPRRQCGTSIFVAQPNWSWTLPLTSFFTSSQALPQRMTCDLSAEYCQPSLQVVEGSCRKSVALPALDSK